MRICLDWELRAHQMVEMPLPWSIRDSSPLNQFVYTDYTTAKEKATAAYKSGDYTTALKSYTICLGCLP